jgi:hypothetical protein
MSRMTMPPGGGGRKLVAAVPEREMEETIAADKKVLRGCEVPGGVFMKEG